MSDEKYTMTETETNSPGSEVFQHRHLQMDALPSAFKNAFEKFVRSKLPEPESKPNTQFALTSCVFDTETKMLKVKIDPSSICKKIDLSKIIGKKRYILALDVSGSMGHKATEMVSVLVQIEEELGQLLHIVDIRLLFFSSVLMEIPVGEIASVKTAQGFWGGTDFRPPLNVILSLCKQDPETEHVALLMTDGYSSYGWEEIAREIHNQKNVTMIGVGYGDNVSTSSLESIANGTWENIYSFTGENSSEGLYDLLQTLIGADLDIMSFPGVITTSGGKEHQTCYFPYTTDENETGLQTSLYLGDVDLEDGESICHDVHGISEIVAVKITRQGSSRHDTIIAMKNTLDLIFQNNVLTKDEGRVIAQLNRQIVAISASDRRCQRITRIINSISNFIETGGELETAKPHLVKLRRFVNSLASSALVSGRHARTVNKAAAKTNEMLQYVQRAQEAVQKTHSIHFQEKAFEGDDILLGSVSGETKQYPVLLVTNTRDGYESPSEFSKFLTQAVTEATQLVQPASAGAPKTIGFVFPSEIDEENLPTTFQDMLDSLVRCKIHPFTCVSQETDQELEYSKVMFRIVASLLTLGITTQGPNSVCWNLGSAGMEPAANRKTKSPLVMTTLMSYFNAFKTHLGEKGLFHNSKLLEYFKDTNRFFATSTTQDVTERLENIWMGLGMFYCLPRLQMQEVFSSVARSIVFESMRQALNAKLKNDPNVYKHLQDEFVSRLCYGNVMYDEADETTEIDNPNSWMWNSDFSIFEKKVTDCGLKLQLNNIKKIVDMNDANKSLMLNTKIRKLVKLKFPYDQSRFDISKENLFTIASSVLGSDQNRNEMVPNWLSAEQLADLFNTLHFLIFNENDYRFGYIPPHVCESISEYKHFNDIFEIYKTQEEFITDVLFLLSTQGLNNNIRQASAPKCSSDFQSFIPGPAKASAIESNRTQQFISNIITWSIANSWPASTIVSLFSSLGHKCDTEFIVNAAYELASKYSDPSLFPTIVTSCIDPAYFEEGSLLRNKIDEVLNKQMFENTKDDIIYAFTRRFQESLPKPSVLCSRNFNKDMGNMIMEAFKVLDKSLPVETSTFTIGMLNEAKTKSSNSLLRKGCGYYVNLFKEISFVVKMAPDGPKIFIDKIGNDLERRFLDIPKKILYGTGSNKEIRFYIWGVSKNLESTNHTCRTPPDQLLIKSQIQNIRDHYRNVKIPPNVKDPTVCYPYFSHVVKYYDDLLPKLIK